MPSNIVRLRRAIVSGVPISPPPHPHCSTELVALVVWSALYDLASCCLRYRVNGCRKSIRFRSNRYTIRETVDGKENREEDSSRSIFKNRVIINKYSRYARSICLPRDFGYLWIGIRSSNHRRDDYPIQHYGMTL